MSTNAVIIVEGQDQVKVYKHWDGYPDATLPWLEQFNRQFTDERGDDSIYKFAQLLRSSYRDSANFGLDPSEFTGWGVIPIDGDYGEEYTYVLKTDGTVEVHEGHYSEPDQQLIKEAVF